LTYETKSGIYSDVVSMTGKDYHDILNLVYRANRCEDRNSLIGTICPSMMQMFRSECFTFQLIEGYPSQPKILESRSFKEDNYNLVEDKHYPSLYREKYHQSSPLLKETISSPKTVFKFGESIPLKNWERSDFYNYFISPQHLYWEMFLPLRWKNRLKGMITLWRSKRQPNYKADDESKAEMLTRHLMLAIYNVNTISNINDWKTQILDNDDSNNEGLLLLDHKLKPVYSNAKAREICLYLFNRTHDSFDLEKYEFPIPSCIVKDCYNLLNLLRVEERLILWPKERIIFAENGRQYRIECSLVWKTTQIITVPHLMITLSDLTSKKRLEVILQARFHLSNREVDIVYCLMADMSYIEIAEKLYISKQTVHTHIKNIYRKLGIKNKIELFRCVQSPSWLI
jgi:DNA-binding CsgD family transcriptional regulator